ncbi:MAG: helix-turn-helix transcriptional regulator [Cellulosilyticum sp.]|nr:helix-turn-helix transcriptional regulator [Cellulosilyticum sp.]
MPVPIKEPFHFEIKYVERPAHYNMPTIAICKTHYEISYLLSGDRRTITSLNSYDRHAGDISTTPLNVYYHGIPLSNTTYKNILIKFHKEMAMPFIQIVGELAFDTLFGHWIHHFTKSTQQKIEHIFYNMLDEYNHYNELSELVLQGMLHNLLAIMIHERIPTSSEENSLHKINPLIMDALSFMEHHYLENPSLKEVATHISISPEYLSRLFKQTLGTSYSDYQNRIRLRHAYRLLEQTSLSIGEIAEQAGFSNGNYMCDVMKRYIGISPTAYRKLSLHKN